MFHYQLEEQDEQLRRVLSEYSEYMIQREMIPGFADSRSGTKRVRMDTAQPAPNLVKILDRYVECFEYEGAVG